METKASSALHDVQTAIKDVLAGYDTLEERAEPEILPIVRKLKDMHHRHSTDIARHLTDLGEHADDEASIRGSVNKAVVAMRDWVSDLDADALSFVRDGEERLMGIYDDALNDAGDTGDFECRRLLSTQRQQIKAQTDQLPAP